jgi:hypothetical protein
MHWKVEANYINYLPERNRGKDHDSGDALASPLAARNRLVRRRKPPTWHMRRCQKNTAVSSQ